MSKQADFVEKSVYDECRKAGVCEEVARSFSKLGRSQYEKSMMGGKRFGAWLKDLVSRAKVAQGKIITAQEKKKQ